LVAGQRGEIELKRSLTEISQETQPYVHHRTIRVKARALYDVLPKIPISNKSNDNGLLNTTIGTKIRLHVLQQWLQRWVFSRVNR
jgi:hypothetical protein